MKTKQLMAALALCLGGTAFAYDPVQESKDVRELKEEAKKPAGEAAKPGEGERGLVRSQGEIARDVKKDLSKTASDLGAATEEQGTFRANKAYSMVGTLKDPKGGGVTIVREGLPPAVLDVRDRTVVTLNGSKVDSQSLPEGAKVRAKFQLEGNETVAVELRATTTNTSPAK
jgi:hypothetical protein